MSELTLWQGDCLELMKNIPDKSIDMILCDLPYGTTNNKWDKKIDLQALWEQYKRIIKVNAAIVLFSQMPFCVDLIVSNRKWFRYEWIWQKDNTTGFLNANKMPLKCHENILLFYSKLPTYNPQFSEGTPYYRKNRTVSKCYREHVEFITNDNIKTLTIVKNNGRIETLTKINSCDKIKMITDLGRIKKKNVKTGSDKELDKTVKDFLTKNVKGGIFEWQN